MRIKDIVEDVEAPKIDANGNRLDPHLVKKKKEEKDIEDAMRRGVEYDPDMDEIARDLPR